MVIIPIYNCDRYISEPIECVLNQKYLKNMRLLLFVIPKISVIVCTYNRLMSILDTLQSLSEIIVPEKIDWEVLIVDNNSSDHTKKIVNNFVKDLRSKEKHES